MARTPSTWDSAAPAVGRRSDRLAQARGYHPRGRTLGDDVEPDAPGATRVDSRAGREPDDRPRPGREVAAGRPAPRNRSRSTLRVVSDDSTRTQADRTAAARALRGRTGAFRTVGASSAATRRPGAPARRRVDVVRPVAALTPSRGRLNQIIVVVLLLLGVIAVRLVEFQISEASDHKARGLADRLREVTVPAPRGQIVDRNGAVLAGSAEARLIFSDPTLVTDAEAAADQLSPLLGIPRSELLPKLLPHLNSAGVESSYAVLARGVSVAVGDQVRALKLDGIGVRYDERRIVPGHDLAANLIGFTGTDVQGLAGLEWTYEGLLAGVDGKRWYERGLDLADLGREIPSGYREEIPAQPGRTLQLTVDRDLQFEIQRLLAEHMRRAGAYTGSAVVLDVRTGEVLAQASYPTYDAANPFAFEPSTYGDMASGMLIDPGSIHKAIVVAACLQEGVVGPQDTVPLPNSIVKGATTFTDSHAHPPMANFTLPGILAWSSNVGTILLADRLGADKLYEYQRAFGLGEPIGEGLPGEASGLVQPPENWSADAYGSIPIGHGVAVTPLQMAAVYATIANGGVYIRPHLVKAIVDPDGTVNPTAAPVTRRVLSVENATALRSMLEAVVSAPEATGQAAAIKDYRVAGKTGTGSIVVDNAYGPGEVASFIGMAPADAPQYVVAVVAHTPGGGGGTVAAPAFAEMMKQTLLHYRVMPTGAPAPTFTIYW